MKLILCRRLNGQNEITETADDIATNPGIKNFSEFLAELKMDTHPACLELAQVLKVSHEKFIECAEKGYIDHSSQVNIARYVEGLRFCGEQVDFLQSQSGSEGSKNTPSEYNRLNYQPRVLAGRS